MATWKVLLPFCVFSLLLESGLSESATCRAQEILSDSEVYVIYVSNEDQYCKPNTERRDSRAVQAARETLALLNKNTTISIGIQVLPFCRNDQITRVKLSAKILAQVPTADSCTNDGEQTLSLENTTLIGVVGSGHFGLQHILAGTNIPVITLGETSTSMQSADNVYYTSNPSAVRAKAIADLAVKLNWDYTTVVYASDSTSKDLKLLLEKELKDNLICVDSYTDFSPATGIPGEIYGASKPKGIILLGADANSITDTGRRESLTWIISPRFPEAANFLFTSKSADEAYIVEHLQPNYLSPVWRLISKSVQDALDTDCSGSLSNCVHAGVGEFQSRINNRLKVVNLSYEEINSTHVHEQETDQTFGFKGNMLEPSEFAPVYQVKSANQETISQYTLNGGWNISSANQMFNKFWCTNKQCQSKCNQQIKPKNYTYIHGDFIVIVTMPIHDSFNSYPDLWSCKEFNNEASLRAEAAIFAKERLNTLLKNDSINLGLLILDTCFNTALTQKLLTDVLNGTTEYCNKEHCLDRSKIIGLVGDYSSHISITEQNMMIPSNLLQVAYGASTWKLDNKNVYTHFLRTHPSATRVTTNLIKVLDDLNAKGSDINSVVLVNTNSVYGNSSAELLKSKLRDSPYCLIKEFEVNYQYPETAERYKTLWKKLTAHHKNGGFVVIYVGEEKPIKHLLDNMKTDGETVKWWKESGSIFMMTEVWEDRLPLLDAYGNLTRGSLTFKITPDFGVSGFEKHLLGQRPHSATNNPWFPIMYQKEVNCKLRGCFTSESPTTICYQNVSYLGSNPKINIEIYALYTIKALYALGYGFRNYAKERCKDRPFKNCRALFERTKPSAKDLKQSIANVRIPASDTSSKRDGARDFLMPFDSNLDGRSGFQVYSHRMKENGSKEYVLVYEFSTTDELMVKNVSTFYKKMQYSSEYSEQRIISSNHCEGQCLNLQCSAAPTPEVLQVNKTPPVIIVAIVLGTIIFVLVTGFIAMKLWKANKRGGPKLCPWIKMFKGNQGNNDYDDVSQPSEKQGQDSPPPPPTCSPPPVPPPNIVISPTVGGTVAMGATAGGTAGGTADRTTDEGSAMEVTLEKRRKGGPTLPERLLGPNSVYDPGQVNEAYNSSISLSTTIFQSVQSSDKTDSSGNGRDSSHSLSIFCSDDDPVYTQPIEPLTPIKPSTSNAGSSTCSSGGRPTPLPRQNSQGTVYSVMSVDPSISLSIPS